MQKLLNFFFLNKKLIAVRNNPTRLNHKQGTYLNSENLYLFVLLSQRQVSYFYIKNKLIH